MSGSEGAFVEPGYPIYKAFIIPYRDEEKILDIRRIDNNDVNRWDESLKKLNLFLNRFFEASSTRELSLGERLNLVSDLIILFFRLPLVREILPQVVPSPIKAYFLLRSLTTQWTTKSLRRMTKIQDIFNPPMSQAWDKLSKTPFIKLIDDKALANLVEEAWYLFPADTRPGFNTSNLLSHMFLTSAIAASSAIQKGWSPERVGMIRLAAILHDMGKPRDPRRHFEAGSRYARDVFREVLMEEEIDEIMRFIRGHHIETSTEEGRLLKDADEKASMVDRKNELIEQFIGKDLRRMAEAAGLSEKIPKKWHETDWEFWRSLYDARDELIRKELIEEDPIKELSKRYLKGLRKWERKQLSSGEVAESVEGLETFLIDIGGIQDFIKRAEKLPITVAASLTIDCLTMTFLPFQIQLACLIEEKTWLPYECFIYAAGGINLIIAPRRLSETIERAVRNLEKEYEADEIKLRVVRQPFITDYIRLNDRLAKKMMKNKFTIYQKKEAIDTSFIQQGALTLCEDCYEAIPENKKRCNICKELQKVGGEFHFKKRWKTRVVSGKSPGKLYDISWEQSEGERIWASKWVMEIIAGHDKWELERIRRGEAKRRSLAVVKFDGNLMGLLMAQAISISDALERSIRIDLAMKKAYEKALECLMEGGEKAGGEDDAQKAAVAVKLGTIYLGGDDGLLFMPSWAALPFSLVLSREFTMNMGGIRNLGIGVAAGPAVHSVWSLIEAAEVLMEIAKRRGREKLLESLEKHAEPKGTIAFDIITTGLLTARTADERMKSLRAIGLTTQPLLVDSDGGELSLYSMLVKLLAAPGGYAELFRCAYLASREDEKNEEKERLKRARAVLKEVLSAPQELLDLSPSQVINLGVPFLFARRQLARQRGRIRGRVEGATEWAYQLLGWALKAEEVEEDGKKRMVSLADLDRAALMLGGGVL